MPTPYIEVAKIAREVLTPVVCRIEGVQRRIKKLANRLRKFIAHNSAVHDANLSVNSAITGLLRLVETRRMPVAKTLADFFAKHSRIQMGPDGRKTP